MEIWKDIKDYENYQVSNLGKVKSLKCGKEKILKNNINSSGYYQVSLSKNGKNYGFKIHQLVAMAFLNHIPNGYKFVIDHINSNKLDNKVSNLQIISQRENCYGKRTIKSRLLVGVNKVDNKFRSRITINGKRKHLGLFKTELEAHEAYKKALKNI